MSSRLYRIGSGRAKEEKGKRKSAWSGILPGQRMLDSCVFNDGGKRRRENGWKRRFIEERAVGRAETKGELASNRSWHGASK